MKINEKTLELLHKLSRHLASSLAEELNIDESMGDAIARQQQMSYDVQDMIDILEQKSEFNDI